MSRKSGRRYSGFNITHKPILYINPIIQLCIIIKLKHQVQGSTDITYKGQITTKFKLAVIGSSSFVRGFDKLKIKFFLKPINK